MRFNAGRRLAQLPNSWRIFIFSVFWLILISLLHYGLNSPKETRKIIKMGYMPVISNLAAPILDHVTRKGDKVRFEAVKFSSFAEMAEAVRNNHIQAAFMIAPLSIVLRQQGEDVKVVYIGNRHESTLVVAKNHSAEKFEDLAGMTVAVPMRYSGHYLTMMKMMEKLDMKGQINIVEMNPPDMASAMVSGALDAYFVGEPFAAKSLKSGHSKVLYHVEDIWPDFICNLMVVKGTFIEQDPETVRLLVHSAIRSGIWAGHNASQAAEIAANYWNQPADLVEYALNHPPDRIQYMHYTPDAGQLQEMAALMVRFGLLKNDNLDGLVDARFAGDVDVKGVTDIDSIFRP
ncbi:MAG: ABC transporter substrate-binding protein [Desulfosalsimonadaceae bacterium]